MPQQKLGKKKKGGKKWGAGVSAINDLAK